MHGIARLQSYIASAKRSVANWQFSKNVVVHYLQRNRPSSQIKNAHPMKKNLPASTWRKQSRKQLGCKPNMMKRRSNMQKHNRYCRAGRLNAPLLKKNSRVHALKSKNGTRNVPSHRHAWMN